MPDIEQLSGKLFDAVRDYLARSLAGFAARIDELEAAFRNLRIPEKGEPGKDADMPALEARLSELVAALPRPVNGKDADPVEVARMVDAAVAKIPVPKDGEPGRPGDKGEPGKSVSIDEVLEAVGPRLVGTVTEAVAREMEGLPALPASFFINDAGALIGAYQNGSTKTIGSVRGKDGLRGASIMDGSVDGSGQLVLRMSDGRFINAGVVRGEPGKAGESKPGTPGRDAVEIRILPAIDESKSYPEGTCASFRGGTIRAERATDPIGDDLAAAGWRVLLEGIADENEVEADGGRYIERTTVYTSGRVFSRKSVTAALIYRGVWADSGFLRGDLVTWDGSLWHCEKQTRAKPGLSADWKLAAKRGRDGKDATRH